MRSAPRPLAIVLATSAVSLSLFTGCEGDEASRADKRVNQQIRTAYATDKPLDALKAAADEDKASGASRARAKAMLADAELLAANNQMRQIEQNENQIASLVWELGQLGQQIQTSSRLIDAYRSYDPSVVQTAAQQHVAEVKGDKLTLDLRGQKVALPALTAVSQNIAQLQDAIGKQKAELDQVTAQRNQLLQQADQAAQQAENAKGRDAVDAYAKASGLRKDAALLSNKIDLANASLARLNADLATQQGQQQILSKLAQDYTDQASATEKGFKAVASQEEAQRRLIKDIYGSAPAAKASDAAPASTPGTILSRASQLAAAVNENDQLRASALSNLNNAVQHYTEAQQAAEDLRRKIDEKMGAAGSADAPERLAWEDMKKLINPSAYQLQKSNALQALGSLYANQSQSLASRVRLAGDLSKALQAAGLKLPADLEVKDAANQLKEVRENASKAFADASDLESTVIEAPLATESQKSAARVAKILTTYSWSNALAEAGNAAEAKKHRAEAVDLVKGAVADNVTLPALPPDIAPAPKVAAPPASTPSSAPAKATANAAQGTPADAATVAAVKQSLTTVLDAVIKGDGNAVRDFIIAAPEQQPLVDTLASMVDGLTKLQNAVVAKFGTDGGAALAAAGVHIGSMDPNVLRQSLGQFQIMSTGPETVALTKAGELSLPMKKVGDQWKVDLAAAVQANPQVGAMLPMMTTMFKPVAAGVNQIAADVEAGKYASADEVKAALQKVLPNPAGFPGMTKTVAQEGAAPAPTPAQ